MTEVAEKKERKPRRQYGYAATSVIKLVPEKEHSYRGHRKAWYERVAAFEGRTVAELEAECPADPKNKPRGWLRFFTEDGTVVLEAA
jgi:hypothetical protein